MSPWAKLPGWLVNQLAVILADLLESRDIMGRFSLNGVCPRNAGITENSCHGMQETVRLYRLLSPLISLQDHSDDKNHAKSKSGLLWSPFCWSLQVKPKQIRMFFLDFLSCEVLKKVGRILGFGSSRWEQDGRGSDDPMSREMEHRWYAVPHGYSWIFMDIPSWDIIVQSMWNAVYHFHSMISHDFPLIRFYFSQSYIKSKISCVFLCTIRYPLYPPGLTTGYPGLISIISTLHIHYINIKNVTYPACHTKDMETHHLWIIFLGKCCGFSTFKCWFTIQSPILLDKMNDNAIILDRMC